MDAFTRKHTFFYPSALALLLATSLPVFAQSTYVALSGNLLHNTYSFNQPLNEISTAVVFPWEGRFSGFSPSFGLNVIRSVSEKWEIRTGLNLLTSGYVQQTDLQWPSEFTSQGYQPLLPDERLAIRHLFLEIPVALRYRFTSRSFSPVLEAGISGGYYMTSRIGERLEGNNRNSWKRLDAVNTVHLALRCAAGVQYRFAGRHALFVQPALRYQTGDTEKTSSNPGVSWGVEAGWMLAIGPRSHTGLHQTS